MKYKEEIINDISDVKVGDLVKAYNDIVSPEFKVGDLGEEHIYRHDASYERFSYHYKQCRKLVSVEPRVFWIRLNKSIVSGNEYYDGYDYKPTDGSKWIKVQEVLE